MSAIVGESPAEKPIGNPSEGNISKSTGPIEWDISWPEYAVQQAQIVHKTIESTVENVIEVTRSRVDRILTTSSAHFNQTVDNLQNLKSEYITYEDIVLGEIKEGFLYASSRPLITTGVVLGVGFLGLKRTRQFLSYSTRRLFFSEETLLSRVEAKVKELRQSMDLLKAESKTLEKKALQAEEDLVRGRTTEKGHSSSQLQTWASIFQMLQYQKIYDFSKSNAAAAQKYKHNLIQMHSYN
ncbi:hypothetical protein PHJA_002417200 [Phtheirospermum japonicum]|uniref:Uncharacterized protein n=1 Tax=Phtheirospermum japonicum TaxID=374723 RepID=A0A830AXK0_9LAMI|nr:hypothetical protein PHJA_000084500 [Phtheirospermum japonicum]GFQ02733.1 hypothetical protein PHJA_002417200 [Phtheirospermum japonicum]